MKLSSRLPPFVLTNLLSFRWPRALQILPSLLCGQCSPGSLGFGHTQLQIHQMYPCLTNCRLPSPSVWNTPASDLGMAGTSTYFRSQLKYHTSSENSPLPLVHYPLNSSFFIIAPYSLWSYLLSCISAVSLTGSLAPYKQGPHLTSPLPHSPAV